MSDTGAPVSGGAAPVAATTDTGSQDSQPQQQVKSDAAPAAQPKSWKSKVDGKEVTWDNEEQLLRDASLGKTSYDRMRQAAEMTKTTQKFIEAFKKDPMAALEDPSLGLDDDKRREIIEKYYQKKYLETDNLTPQQKKIMELEKKLQAREEADKAAEEAQKSEQQKQLEGKWRETYQQQIIEAIEKGGFPKTPKTAARVAFYMHQAAEAGFDAPLETIIAQVGKDYEQELGVILAENVPMEAILKVLPPDFLKRLRKYDIDQYKSRQQKGMQPPAASEDKAVKPKKEERLSYAEVLKKFG